MLYGILYLALGLVAVGLVVSRTSIHLGFKTAIIIIYILLFLNYFGAIAFLNYPINAVITGTPLKTCGTLHDCVIKKTSCGNCDCGDSVNKEWEPICLLKVNNYTCKPCPERNVYCSRTVCQTI